MSFPFRAEGLDFLTTAPETFVFRAPVHASPTRVFEAISADPSTWTWFPAVTGGSYESAAPHGVGSTREVTMGNALYHQTIIAWDCPRRWAYRVDSSSIPLADAIVEEWAILEGDADRETIVRWTIAIDPKPLFRTGKVAAGFVMGELFRKAMGNLSELLEPG